MLPVFKPSIKRKDMDSVLSCLVSEVLGPATLGERLLKILSDDLNAAGGCAVREYPRAIALAFRALGLERGARIALSPLLPWVYHYVCAELGMQPVYVDVDRQSPVIDPQSLQKVGDVAAVVVDATLGFAADLERLVEFGMPIIEDVSQGLGATAGQHSVGTVGRYVICGLEPEHIITAGGGAALLARGRRERAALKAVSDGLPRELFLPDMNAALGVIQALELQRLNSRRREIAAIYAQSIAQSHHRTPVQHGEGENVDFSYPVFVESGVRDVIAYARKKSIEVIPAFGESVLGKAVGREAQHGDEGSTERDGSLPDQTLLPNARGFLLRCLLFPLYPMLKKDEVELVQRVLATLP